MDGHTSETLATLKNEMIDRFGALPESILNLIKTTSIKLRALTSGINRIDLGKNGGRIEFGQQPNIDTKSLIGLVERQSEMYSFTDGNRLRLHHLTQSSKERFELIDDLLNHLAIDEYEAFESPS